MLRPAHFLPAQFNATDHGYADQIVVATFAMQHRHQQLPDVFTYFRAQHAPRIASVAGVPVSLRKSIQASIVDACRKSMQLECSRAKRRRGKARTTDQTPRKGSRAAGEWAARENGFAYFGAGPRYTALRCLFARIERQ